MAGIEIVYLGRNALGSSALLQVYLVKCMTEDVAAKSGYLV